MFRLIAYASAKQNQEMSFLRRILEYSRLLLRNHHLILPKKQAPELLKIHSEGRGAAANLNHASPTPSSTPFGRIGSQIHAQVRQIFINNVLRRATANQEVAKKAAQRLLYGDSRPFFALVGVSLATGSVGVVSRDSEFDGICWEIRESIAKQTRAETTASTSSSGTEDEICSVEDLEFGPILSKGCNAAVYRARFRDREGEEDWNLAVKMLFNYDIESNAFAILKGMVKEIVPARRVDLKELCDLDRNLFANVQLCPPHPHIINVQQAFVDKVPLLPEGMEVYPSALPRRLNPDDGLGRNMSLFLVMKRYDTNLQEYLKEHKDITHRTRLLILTQLLNGVAHLEVNQIAHRDLKTDNILVDLSQGHLTPEVVISDFGCCLADKTHGLSVPFRTMDTDRGGNPALTAPEISTAVPGAWKYLNFYKSDAFAVGAIAYEIFSNPNPFYGSRSSPKTRLDSRTYKDEDLPEIENANYIVQRLIRALLRRNPDQRLSAETAFNVGVLLLWAPSEWLQRSYGRCPSDDEILQWLVCLTAKALCYNSEEVEFKIMRSFLRRVRFSVLKSAVSWIVHQKKE